MTSTGAIVTAGKREMVDQGNANSHNRSGTAVGARRSRFAASLKALLRCSWRESATPTSGTVSTTPAIAPSSSSKSSTRIDGMMRRRSEFATEVEFEIDASRDHWSELQSTEADSVSNSVSSGHEGEVPHQTNSVIVRSLQRQWPGTGTFFIDVGDALVVGAKIAEGGQAEIFDVEDSQVHVSKNAYCKYVLKVFKEGSSMRDLQRQWPKGMLQQTVGSYNSPFALQILRGTVVMNGRFAFQMEKCWGDLRKLMDYRLQYNRMKGCEMFTSFKLESNMLQIAKGMKGLHKRNIIHRDLKAANVLLSTHEGFDPGSDERPINSHSFYECFVADYECSVGVVGTGFWRAPEILEALKNRNVTSDVFTQASDVYSYAMTCYEMITGLLPFEDVLLNDYDVVLRGKRPPLPKDIELWIGALVSRCWHPDPLKRPSFEEIVEHISGNGFFSEGVIGSHFEAYVR